MKKAAKIKLSMYKSKNLTKRQILQNGESEKKQRKSSWVYTILRILQRLQNGESYKTANLKKNGENQAEYIQFKES